MTDTSTHADPPPAGPPPTPPEQRTGAVDDVFGTLRSSGFFRDTDSQWFGGVCSGLAARFAVDPLLIRAVAIVLGFAGGIGIAAYLLLWLLLPDRRGSILGERALRQGEVWPVVLGIVTTLFVVGSLFSFGINGDSWNGTLWIVLPIALVVWLLAARSRRGAVAPDGATPYPPPPTPPTGGPAMAAPTSSFATPAGAGYAAPPPGPHPPRYGEPGAHPGPYGGAPLPPVPPRPAVPIGPPPPPTPRRRRPSGYVGLVSLGLAVALFGTGIALEGPLDLVGDPPILAFALALAGVSAVVLALGLRGRASGFSGFLVVVLGLTTVLATAVAAIPASDGVGDQTWAPTAGSLPADYSLGAGDATLDLTSLASLTDLSGPDGADSEPLEISADLGAGELVILVPEGLDVRIDGRTGFGEIQHVRTRGSGSSESVFTQTGPGLARTVVLGTDAPDLVVTAEVGLGVILIEEEN